MFTVCSKCNLRLTVTATDLRAAQGYVRCGRCHNVFNALAALADDPARLADQAPATDTQNRLALTLQEPAGAEPPAPEKPAENQPAADTSLEFNPASTNINEVFIEASADERTGTFESITLSGEDPAAAAVSPEPDPVIAPQALSAPAVAAPTEHEFTVDVQGMRDALAEPDHPRPMPDLRAAAASSPQPVAAAPAPAAVVAAAPVAAATAPEEEIPFTSTWSAATANTPDEGFAVNAAAASQITRAMDEADAAQSRAQSTDTVLIEVALGPKRAAARIPRWLLQGAVGILTLCLIGQLLHHYRNQLADTSLLRRPVNALYQLLGRPLEARWDITRYEIRQLGATTDGAPAGQLVVRASISNRATRDQPLPLLRVVMQDRFGNRVAARDLKPAEYLGRGAPQVSLMAPGQRVDVQVAFQDPGQAATGFEIDACMAGHAGTVTCANDPGGH
jgi:predicted Zn finger-like uncharacterized protein